MEIRLDYQNGHGHYTSTDYPCRSGLWVAVDYQKPGTLMVAALNMWWPDGNIFRSTDGGATWTRLWDWNKQGVSSKKFYTFNNAIVPWLSPNYTVTTLDLKQFG